MQAVFHREIQQIGIDYLEGTLFGFAAQAGVVLAINVPTSRGSGTLPTPVSQTNGRSEMGESASESSPKYASNTPKDVDVMRKVRLHGMI